MWAENIPREWRPPRDTSGNAVPPHHGFHSAVCRASRHTKDCVLTAAPVPDPEAAAQVARALLRDQLLASGIRNFKVYNPLWLKAGSKIVDEALQSTIESLWQDDPISPVRVRVFKYVRGLEAYPKISPGGGQRKASKEAGLSHSSGLASCRSCARNLENFQREMASWRSA